jgi:hypothetical protein
MQSKIIFSVFASVAECVGVQIEGRLGPFTITSHHFPLSTPVEMTCLTTVLSFENLDFRISFYKSQTYLVMQKSLNAVIKYMMYSQDGIV